MYYYPIHFKTFGKGKKFVLFLHGWGGSTNSFLSVAEKISKEHKVMLIDFYGFGKTKFPDKSLDTYEYALQLYLFLHNHAIKEIDLVAHSFGGRVAIILSSLFDIKINNLILVDSAGITPKRGLNYKVKVFKYKLYKKLNKYGLLSGKKLTRYGSEEYKQLNDIQKISYVKIVNQGLEYLLKNIKSKTLIVWGVNDNTTPVYMAERLKKYIERSHVVYYENSGHFCYLENYCNFCNLVLNIMRGES